MRAVFLAGLVLFKKLKEFDVHNLLGEVFLMLVEVEILGNELSEAVVLYNLVLYGLT